MSQSRIRNVVIGLCLIISFSACDSPFSVDFVVSEDFVEIYPDYTDITIPCNIAPLNFTLIDSVEKCYVELNFNNGDFIKIKSNNGDVLIPQKKWEKALQKNVGTNYTVAIYTKSKGQWVKYKQITNTVSVDSIDSYLVYRYINPANVLWHSMGIYQRSLQNFEVTPIMDNSLTEQNCMNCHSFASNNANSFMFHMRGKPGGTIIYANEELRFVDTKTDKTISAGGYPAWHPEGKYIAFSTNKIHQRFHAIKEKYAFVYDSKSDIVLYDLLKNEIILIPQLSSANFENMPAWSADGSYLYFLNSPEHDPNKSDYKDIKYDLRRISFCEDSKTFGEVEVVLALDSINKSIAFPRISPDNNYVLFCLAESGYFTVYNETSDLAIFDIQKKKVIRPEFNSPQVESYPSWSYNGKWLMFNSKRDDGVCSRPYFAYFENGVMHKPFVLPQKDPMNNIKELKNYNRPELVKSKVMLNPRQINKLVQGQPVAVGVNEDGLTDSIRSSLVDVKEAEGAFDFNQ